MTSSGQHSASPTTLQMVPKPILRRTEVQNLLACTAWEPGTSEAAAFGSAFHDAVADYLATCRTHGEESRLADVDRVARDAFFRVPRGLDPGALDDLRALLDRFARSHVADLGTLMHVEHTLTADADFAVLTGTLDRIDRLDDGEVCEPPTDVRITDWKTSWAVDDHSFQLRFYGALACLTWPTVVRVWTRADHVRLSNGVVEAEYTRAELLRFWSDVLHGVRVRLAAHAATPAGGAACRYCGSRRTCAASLEPWRSVPDSGDQARRGVLADLVRLEAAAEVTRSVLKRYFADRDPVTWDGCEVGFLPPREPVWRATDPLAVQAYLQGRGVDARLGLDARQVPDALKEELVRAGLASYEPGRVEFRIRKAPTQQ